MSSFEALAGAAALALSVAAVAHAQQAPASAAPAPARPTDAQIAASPAVKRLRELLQVINSGDAAAIKAYLQTNGVDAMKASGGPGGPGGALPLVGSALDLHRRSRGLDLVRIVKVEDSGATAIVLNKLTGDEQPLAVKIEAQAPHRIVSLPSVPPSTIAAFLRPAPSVPRSEKAQLQQIGSYLKRLADADVFSGVVMIARDGKPVFSEAYGYADREKKIPNKVDTPFLLGSMNKLFTGLAIGQLVEQGKLSYEDPLSKFIPDFPDAESAKRIKIKHLLSHTSGLGSYFNPDFFKSIDKLRTVQSVLDVAGRQPPQFEPGTKWLYSNTGMQLLGRVIEIVTGQDYYDYMARNVFARAGTKSIGFPHYDRDGVAVASPYEIEFDGQGLKYGNRWAIAPRRGSPAGDAMASAPDLIKFSQALYAGKIVKPETLRLHSSAKLDLASPNYGYGITPNARMAKRPLVGHGGNAPGICTEYGVLADTAYTIVILSNSTGNMCIPVTAKILQLLPPTKAPAA